MRSTTPNEDGVTVVQDTNDYLGYIHSSKGRGARWVRGLAPEDEENERSTLRTREEIAAADEERRVLEGRRQEDKISKRWLRKPLLLGIASFCLFLLTYADKAEFTAMMLRDFPEAEEQVWAFARMPGENAVNFVMRVVLPLALPGGVSAVSVGWLCLLLGSAAHHFTTLCGVGIAMLSFFGLAGQATILWLGCGRSPVSHKWECDIPIAFYWVCSLVRVGSPMLALWCTGPVLDIAHRRQFLKYTLALPFTVFIAAVMMTIRNEEPAVRLFQLAYETALCVGVVFIVECWNQPIFTLVIRELKAHRD